MEIFTDRDELTLKKYSPIATLEEFSESTAKSLNLLSGKLAVICDTDGILHASGEGKRDLEGKRLAAEMDKILRERKSYLANASDGDQIVSISEISIDGVTSQIIVPIVANGDCIGAVALLSRAENEKMDSNLLNLVRLTAEILSNHFE